MMTSTPLFFFMLLLFRPVYTISSDESDYALVDSWFADSPLHEHENTPFSSHPVHSSEHGEGSSSQQRLSHEATAPMREDRNKAYEQTGSKKRKVRSDKGKVRPWSDERMQAERESGRLQQRAKKASATMQGRTWTQARRDAESRMRIDGREKLRIERISRTMRARHAAKRPPDA